MKKIYEDFKEIKDKSVKINKNNNSYSVIFNNSSNTIQFKINKNGYFFFYGSNDDDFNPQSLTVEDNFFYYKINNKKEKK